MNTSIFLALGIAIGLVALAAWVTHWIWFIRSFGSSGLLFADNGVLNVVLKNRLRYFLGVMGLMVPIVGIIHGFAIWAGAGVRLRD